MSSHIHKGSQWVVFVATVVAAGDYKGPLYMHKVSFTARCLKTVDFRDEYVWRVLTNG